MGEEGLEPPTDYLEGSCSIQLSYSPALKQYNNILDRQIQQFRLYFLCVSPHDLLDEREDRQYCSRRFKYL